MPNAIERGRKHAELLRAEAKIILHSAFKLPEGVSSPSLDRFVDCIISAAVIKAAIAQYDAMEKKQNG